MPRMLRRAAVLGATAHVASKRGQAKGAAEAQEQAARPPLNRLPYPLLHQQRPRMTGMPS